MNGVVCVVDFEWKLYPQQGYQVVTDESVRAPSLCPALNDAKRLDSFFRKGMRRTAAAVMVTHRWLAPHLLVFLRQEAQRLRCGLFSVKYGATENPKQVLLNRLNTYLRPLGSQDAAKAVVGEFLGTWWVAGNSDFEHPLPYVPAHCTRPREMIRLYQVVLPPEVTFFVSPGYTLKSIPIFDLVTHRPALPPALQQLPFMLARFVFTYFEAGDDDEALGRGLHGTTPKPLPQTTTPQPKKPPQTTGGEDQAQRSHVQMLLENLKDDTTKQ
eukprot:Protomagalhaensia_sp_Gyna_25__2860@NODE_2665_length_953_cov_15_398249_g2222_i0_p1_GENE_NODE_2665_length_953_cov_15_398249_g2222_i0NODE_2665_length_953_cov_15_398249_g2222_i0_p1_ORF_typecomplete_len270_score37_02NUDIX_2/PF13869_6/8_2e34_NODE_2665_length_953_cov_15_398249_g2222_i058867